MVPPRRQRQRQHQQRWRLKIVIVVVVVGSFRAQGFLLKKARAAVLECDHEEDTWRSNRRGELAFTNSRAPSEESEMAPSKPSAVGRHRPHGHQHQHQRHHYHHLHQNQQQHVSRQQHYRRLFDVAALSEASAAVESLRTALSAASAAEEAAQLEVAGLKKQLAAYIQEEDGRFQLQLRQQSEQMRLRLRVELHPALVRGTFTSRWRNLGGQGGAPGLLAFCRVWRGRRSRPRHHLHVAEGQAVAGCWPCSCWAPATCTTAVRHCQ